MDFERFRRESAADRMPRHLLTVVADELDAELAAPDPSSVGRLDRVLAVIYGQPHHWALARRTFRRLDDGDGVFTTGCDAGIPLALLCAVRRRNVAFAISFIDPTRPRAKALGWILALLLERLLILVTLDEQEETVRRSFGRVASGVATLGYTTDCEFFRPEPAHDATARSRAVVAGSGTEQRDYATLAEAIAEMDVDGRVCFVSPNFSAKTRYTMPDPVPANLEFRHYEFDELRTLYQRADVMVVPLIENRYSAGLTALFEAIASECPVIITESPNIIERLVADDLVVGVPAGSVDELRQAIKNLVTDRDGSRARAVRAREHLLAHHSTSAFLDRLDHLLNGLVGNESAGPGRNGSAHTDRPGSGRP
ncbi:MAG: glycosyltransferase [Acidimicrobiia bacterium]|nr:glycosyltransferase [Acidimicrobiia bacterium]